MLGVTIVICHFNTSVFVLGAKRDASLQEEITLGVVQARLSSSTNRGLGPQNQGVDFRFGDVNYFDRYSNLD